jgi:hypothetical protein
MNIDIIAYYFLIFDFLSIDEVSSIDIAYTNKKMRKDILLLFKNLKINTEKDANLNKDYFMDIQFYKYINQRQIPITSYTIFNNRLKYILEKPLSYNNNLIQYLKIFEENIKIKQLEEILTKYTKLKTLSFGSNMDEFKNSEFRDSELHYELYPNIFNHIKLINFTDNDNNFRIDNTVLEKLYLVCTNLPYDICYKIILASTKLKKISIRTNNDGFFDLISSILKINTIEEIEIFDNTLKTRLYFDKILNIFNELLKMNLQIIKLKFDVEDITGGNGHLNQTIITIYTAKIKIKFVLQYIIHHIEVEYILNKCQYVKELSIKEEFNSEIPKYSFLLNIRHLLPSTIETITICIFDENNIKKIINKIKTIKKINIDFMFISELGKLEIIRKTNKTIQFYTKNICM